ncbi:MAG: RecX family transcriptional regulator [Paenibacillus sp.]|jgi:regulatory protein|uniref:RecX family transcriptional regulator n=1 Tax=Paenibacillus sp. GCM10012303 TaxID=3317340 RepID=UPI0029EF1AC1|nr:RecX family transcriptional regulator [Paenibacillus sp.]
MNNTESLITAVERHPRRNGRYLIYLDGQHALTVYEEVLIKHRLLKGERVEADKLRRVLEDEEQQRAWSDALKHVGRRPRSEKEVRQFLKRKEYTEPLIDRIIQRLKEQRYLDDADFAALWTEQRIYSQKKGSRWVKQELQQKGVAPATIQEALDQVRPDEEERICVELGLKKWKLTSGTSQDKRRKTAGFLMRRGYSASIVGKAIRRIIEEAADEDERSEDSELWEWPEE